MSKELNISSSQIVENINTQSTVRDYITLLKPSVMLLVVFCAFVGMKLAPGPIHPLVGFFTILCVALGSGGAAALNMWWDSDIDAKMSRTENRPIVTGKIIRDDALVFGICLCIASVFMMMLYVNVMSGFMLLISIVSYVWMYTMHLKRSTIQNIVIGGSAGAFPPVIGWMATTNSCAIEPWLLFLIVFLWTPPHFWALAIKRVDDYANANVPMMPVVMGVQYTQKRIMLYSILMVISSLLPYYYGMVSIWYLAIAVGIGAYFLYLAYMLYKYGNSYTMKLFFFSIIYLFILFGAMLI